MRSIVRDTLTIGFALVLLVVGALVNDASNAFTALGLMTVSSLVAGGLAVGLTASRLGPRLAEVLGGYSLDGMDRDALAALSKEIILSRAALHEFESHYGVSQIWVITREPELDSAESGTSFRGAMKENIRRGVHYWYVVPNDVGPTVEMALVGALPSDSLRVVRIPMEQWAQLPLTAHAITIYNPNALHGQDPCVAYFEYPDRDPLVWGRIETRTATKWADQIRRLAPELPAP